MGVNTWLPLSRFSEGHSGWTIAMGDTDGWSRATTSFSVNISSSISSSSNLIDLAETELDLRFRLKNESGLSTSSIAGELDLY